MKGLNWEKLLIIFPEFGSEKKRFWQEVSLVGEYGYELSFPILPEWLQNCEIEVNGQTFKDFYRGLCQPFHDSVVGEITQCQSIFDSWRAQGLIHVYDNDHNRWTGNLTNHIEFIHEVDESRGVDEVRLWDYYDFQDLTCSHGKYPTDRLLKFAGLPQALLKPELVSFAKMSKDIIPRTSHGCNAIKGKSISDCVKKADEIYQHAEELRQLRI